MLENTANGTEFRRIFCSGIGPLQLGVALVLFTDSIDEIMDTRISANNDSIIPFNVFQL